MIGLFQDGRTLGHLSLLTRNSLITYSENIKNRSVEGGVSPVMTKTKVVNISSVLECRI